MVTLREVRCHELFTVAMLLHNLPLADERGLLFPEVNLIVQTVGPVDNRLDYGIDDLTAVHADADFVADFVRFTFCDFSPSPSRLSAATTLLLLV